MRRPWKLGPLLVLCACGTPSYTVPEAQLRPVSPKLEKLRIEVTELLVGDRWRFFRGSETHYISAYEYVTYNLYEAATGVSDASWCLAHALESHGFSVESERIGDDADLRVTALVGRPEPAQVPTGLSSKVHIFVSDGSGRLLVKRVLSKPVEGTSLFDSERRALLDARPNHLPFAALILQDVVDALTEAASSPP